MMRRGKITSFAAVVIAACPAVFAAEPKPTPDSSFVQVADGRLYYQECGSGEEALVLVHDGIVDSAVWDDVWPGLCRRFHVRLAEIRAPTLILVGDADIPDVHAHAGAIEAGIANARRVVIPSVGHLMYLEKPDEFARIVSDFLDTNP